MDAGISWVKMAEGERGLRTLLRAFLLFFFPVLIL